MKEETEKKILWQVVEDIEENGDMGAGPTLLDVSVLTSKECQEILTHIANLSGEYTPDRKKE